jgi:hypothetical protein
MACVFSFPDRKASELQANPIGGMIDGEYRNGPREPTGRHAGKSHL